MRGAAKRFARNTLTLSLSRNRERGRLRQAARQVFLHLCRLRETSAWMHEVEQRREQLSRSTRQRRVRGSRERSCFSRSCRRTLCSQSASTSTNGVHNQLLHATRRSPDRVICKLQSNRNTRLPRHAIDRLHIVLQRDESAGECAC